MTTPREHHGWGSSLMLFLIASGALLALPGLLAGFAVDGILHLDLDRGQLWMLGASLAGGAFLISWLIRGFAWAATLHTVACAASVWILAVAHFGAHAAWGAAFLSRVFNLG